MSDDKSVIVYGRTYVVPEDVAMRIEELEHELRALDNIATMYLRRITELQDNQKGKS
jgi:hypothetical protein